MQYERSYNDDSNMQGDYGQYGGDHAPEQANHDIEVIDAQNVNDEEDE